MSDVRRALDAMLRYPLTSTYSDPVAEAETRARGIVFGELLKKHRTVLGLKQEEVAERAGVHLSTYSRWERGIVRNPVGDELRAVCGVVGLSTITAGLVLGYLAPEEAGELPEPPRRFDPTVEEAIAILEDEGMPREKKSAALEYLRFLHGAPETRQPGTDEGRSRAAS